MWRGDARRSRMATGRQEPRALSAPATQVGDGHRLLWKRSEAPVEPGGQRRQRWRLASVTGDPRVIGWVAGGTYHLSGPGFPRGIGNLCPAMVSGPEVLPQGDPQRVTCAPSSARRRWRVSSAHPHPPDGYADPRGAAQRPPGTPARCHAMPRPRDPRRAPPQRLPGRATRAQDTRAAADGPHGRTPGGAGRHGATGPPRGVSPARGERGGAASWSPLHHA